VLRVVTRPHWADAADLSHSEGRLDVGTIVLLVGVRSACFDDGIARDRQVIMLPDGRLLLSFDSSLAEL
jgi:hypothetical protein